MLRFDEKVELTTRRLTAIDSGVFQSVSHIQLFENWFPDDDALNTCCTIISSDLCGQNMKSFEMCDAWIPVADALRLVDVFSKHCLAMEEICLEILGTCDAKLLQALEAAKFRACTEFIGIQ